MQNVLHKTLKAVFGLFIALILVINTFFSYKEYFGKKDFAWSNLSSLLFLTVIFLIFSVVYLFYFKKREVLFQKFKGFKFKEIYADRLVAFLSLFLLLTQCFIFYNSFFLSGWDPYYIRTSAGLIVNKDPSLSIYNIYYSMYPNNKGLVLITALFMRINASLGIFKGQYESFYLVIINCIINSFTCFITYKTLKLFVNWRFALSGFVLIVLLIGFSPWSLIFYSDSFALFIPVLCLYLYKRPLKNQRLRILCRLSAVALGVLGFFIKPQCLILLIAIFILEIAATLSKKEFKKLLKPAALLLCAVLCFSVFSSIINFGIKKSGIEINEGKKMGAMHFVMMGLNNKTNGAYIEEDVTFSKQFETTKDRRRADAQEIKNRLGEMGAKGFIDHNIKKALTVFNDGTFAWNEEGTFYFTLFENPNDHISPFFKSVYYKNGQRHGFFQQFQQIIWILTLILSLFSCFKGFEESEKIAVNVLWLSVLGLILFEILFEARARYLYIFTPIFCIVAIIGLKNLSRITKDVIKRKIIREGRL